MATLTIELDDEILRRARRAAANRGKTVEALVEEYLGTLTGGDLEAQMEAMRQLVERAKKSISGSGGRRWTRDELHDRGRSEP